MHRLRQRYRYSDEDINEFRDQLAGLGTILRDLPDISGMVPHDPTDDMIVACAMAAGADYLVTRDHDMLVLGDYQGIVMITPEAFLHVLRAEE